MEARIHAFEDCYRQYHEKLYRVAYRIAGNREDAEDALQDAYLNAFRSFETFQGQSALSTWLYRITVNSALKHAKTRKHLPIHDKALGEGVTEARYFEQLKSYESVEDTVLTDNLREMCLQMFLECMPRKQRVAFVLKVLLQLPAREAALIMDTSPGAVKTLVYRARQHMVAHLEGRCSLIKAGNPCSCGHWAAYALRTGKDSCFESTPVGRNPKLDYKRLYLSELSTMGKLMALYDVTPSGCPSQSFIDTMRQLIAQGGMRLL